jgi:hypothetical protein
MGYRCAKQSQHRVACILLHRAAVALDLRVHYIEIERLEITNFLRIELFGKRGEANQVTEEHADETALLLWLIGGQGRRDEWWRGRWGGRLQRTPGLPGRDSRVRVRRAGIECRTARTTKSVSRGVDCAT